ncbi:hypothetical protein AMTRI_Chr01g114860 [Amborella trichopoda]
MDISDTRSNLSLGFNVHSISDKHEASGPVRTPIADDSIYFQLDSSFSNDQSSNSASSIPLQLVEQSDYSNFGNSVEDTEVGGTERRRIQHIGLPHVLEEKKREGGLCGFCSERQQHESCSSSPMDLEARRMAVRVWGKQPLANFAMYTGPILPKDRIMGLDSPSDGHLSHGYYTPSGKKVSGASIFFEKTK